MLVGIIILSHLMSVSVGTSERLLREPNSQAIDHPLNEITSFIVHFKTNIVTCKLSMCEEPSYAMENRFAD
jgi:hypothetical protein